MTTVRAEDPDPRRGVRLLTLDRPPANAINGDLLTDLSAALDAAAGEDTVRAVVITGAGRFFSGGLDLRAAGFAEEFRSGRLLSLYRDSHLKLLSFPKPTIAMVNGHAIAGGLILLLACDLRLGFLPAHPCILRFRYKGRGRGRSSHSGSRKTVLSRIATPTPYKPEQLLGAVRLSERARICKDGPAAIIAGKE